MGNPFVHVELATTDLAKAKAFYGQLFEWTSIGSFSIFTDPNGATLALWQTKR